MRKRQASRSLSLAGAGLAAAVACASSCGTSAVPVLSLVEKQGVDGGGVTVTPPLPDASDGSPPLLEAGTQADFCSGSGPPALIDSTGDSGPVCPGQLAQRAFRYALCACGDYTSTGALTTDAFNGAQAPYDAGPAVAAGSVGVNGLLHPGPLDVGGSLWSDSTSGITTTTPIVVAGELHAQGEVEPRLPLPATSTALSVGGDAWLGGGLDATGNVTIGGTLHVPAAQPAKPLSVDGTFTHNATDPTSFTVAQACDCAPNDLVDIAGVVANYATDNDDATLTTPIKANALENVQTDTTVTLSCGRVFLTSIGANTAAIHVIISGRVALFVQGSISTADFVVEVPDTSELDLFVGGNVTVRGAFQVGDATNPARARTYVGGTLVNLQNAATMAGNLYAPFSTLTLGMAAPTTLYGSAFVGSLSSSADLTIHYDEAILAPTPACDAPQACTSSCDCAGQACNGGTCGSCSDTVPCCPPFICSPDGSCVAEVPR
jgi:hypothetical protein